MSNKNQDTITALKSVAESVGQCRIDAEIRGEGAATFLYAKSSRGSSELSFDENGKIFLEFWKPADENATELSCDSLEEATKKLISFLDDR